MYRLKKGRPISLFLFALGLPALVASIISSSNILALIGLGLIFWGALFLYITNERYVKQALLHVTASTSLNNLSQILTDLKYHGNATYLPPHYFTNAETRVYIPQNPTDNLPTPEGLQRQGDVTFLTNPDAVLILPPGRALAKLIEDKLGTRFTKVGLEQLQQTLPHLFLEDLELAENFTIQIEPSEGNTPTANSAPLPPITDELFRVTITNSIYDVLCKEAVQSPRSRLICKIGDPLCSAIACILAETLRKPITIKSTHISDDAKTIETVYRAHETEERLELIEGAYLLPPVPRLPSTAGLLLTASGTLVLAWIGWLTWYDVTTWRKDIVQIFFGSRTGEAISLGLGVRVIHYVLVGVALLVLGLLTLRPRLLDALRSKLKFPTTSTTQRRVTV
jgi:hypothetical protein